MRSVVLVLTLLTVVSAAPFIIPFVDRHEEHVTTRFPATQEAQTIASADFVLVAATFPGCATNISHGEVSDVPDGESRIVEGILSFANIRVNGQTCDTNSDDDVMKLFSYQLLDSILPGDNVIDLSAEAQRAILVGGADFAVRKCGLWKEEFEQRYAFSSDISSLLRSLSDGGYIDNSTVSESMLDEEVTWMVSAPQDGPGRVCLYKQVVHEDVRFPDPTATPDAGDFVSAESSETENGSSSTVGDTSGAGPDRPGNSNSNEDESDQQTIFGSANEAALEMEEEESNREAACFPGSAQVYLADGIVKRMAEVEIGDKVMVAPNVFSEVFMFSHRLHDGDYKFIKIGTDSGNTLSVTAGHYIYINGRPMIAEMASVGDFLELADGTRTAVTFISSVKDRGLYNPQTIEGNIVVNSIRASTYTNALDPSIAHAFLAPLRALFSQLHFRTAYFEGGADSLVRMISMGRVVS